MKEIAKGDFRKRSIDYIFELCKQKDGYIVPEIFASNLKDRGILDDDPRIKESLEALAACNTKIDKDSFAQCISKNIFLIESAFTNSNVIGEFKNFSSTVRDIFNSCAKNISGNVSDTIPQFARQNPDYYGLSICTIAGQRYNIGDINAKFCIDSCVMPFTYCMAVEEHGFKTVHKYVGREPSGVRFNALKVNTIGLPHNPLINSGAIMICSLIRNMLQPSEWFDYLMQNCSDLSADMQMGYSNSAYLSRKNMCDRNYALAHYMKEMRAFPLNVDIDSILDFYFQTLSLKMNTNLLSIMAASLANGGVCPLTGKKVFSPETVKCCLSLMYSCGMYDYSGEFAFIIGLPGKSGCSGAIFVVIPNVMGICTFSPRLDKYNNSVRGVDFFRKFIMKFNFHLFDSMANISDKEDPRVKERTDELPIEEINKITSIGDLSLLKRLVVKENIFSQGDYDYRTPLHLAASNGHLNVIEYFLDEFGTDIVNPLDRFNKTPLDDALREGHWEVVEYLKVVGARRGVDL